ncbi:MAG: tyrosine-type recombinase/integrase [Bacteroidetes bacterium]|nr:tyrosine-type recombinase/integrase [Bacteroidota bacterium]
MKTVEKNILIQFQYYLMDKGYSNKTRMNVMHEVKQFDKWGAYQKIRKIIGTNYTDMLLYIKHCNAIGNQKKTIYLKLLFLRYFFDYLIREKHATENPVANIQLQGIRKSRLHDILSSDELEKTYFNFPSKTTTEKRNKVIVGLLIFQGLRVEEVKSMMVDDVDLKNKKIVVLRGRKREGRILILRSEQIRHLKKYVNVTRKMILRHTGKSTDKLIVSYGSSYNTQNIMRKCLKQLRKINYQISTFDQIRASVITNWMRHFNLRETQYMSGHRYVSSTERYKLNNLDRLVEAIGKYHPM